MSLKLSALAILFLGFTIMRTSSAATKKLDADAIKAIDRAVAAAMELELTPGAVVMAGHGGRVAFSKAYGHLTYDDDAKPAKLDTMYDLASLSKTIGTATSLMILLDRGKIDAVTDPVSK